MYCFGKTSFSLPPLPCEPGGLLQRLKEKIKEWKIRGCTNLAHLTEDTHHLPPWVPQCPSLHRAAAMQILHKLFFYLKQPFSQVPRNSFLTFIPPPPPPHVPHPPVLLPPPPPLISSKKTTTTNRYHVRTATVLLSPPPPPPPPPPAPTNSPSRLGALLNFSGTPPKPTPSR